MASRSPSSPRLSDGAHGVRQRCRRDADTGPELRQGRRAMRSVFETIDWRTEVEPNDADVAPVPELLCHCHRRPPARCGAPLSDPPPPKLDPKIVSPSLHEAHRPALAAAPVPRWRPSSPPPQPRPRRPKGSSRLPLAIPPILPRRRGPEPPDFGRPCPPLP